MTKILGIPLVTKCSIVIGLVIAIPIAGRANGDCSYVKAKEKYKGDVHLLLAKSVTEDCPELIDSVLKNEKDESIFHDMKSFMDGSVAYFLPLVESLKGKSEDDPAVKALVSKMRNLGKVGTYLKSKCLNETTKTEACTAQTIYLEGARTISKRVDQLLADEDAEKTAATSEGGELEGVESEICAHQTTIRSLEANIKNEKEVGRMSGVVSLGNLHGNAARILQSKQRVEMLKKQYKELAGKNFPKNFNCEGHSDQ